MKQAKVVLAGAGGKGSGSIPSIAQDNIRSISYARILDLICEGEIEGFVDLNGRVLLNAFLTSQPTVSTSGSTAGSINDDAVLGFGGAGYSVGDFRGNPVYDGVIDVQVYDPTLNGIHGKAEATVVDGVITRVRVTNPGVNYKQVQLILPYATGKSIYLNGQVLQNSDMTFNFTDVVLDFRVGTQDQAPITGFDSAEETTQVHTSETDGYVQHSSPLTRTFYSQSSDSISIGISFNSLYAIQRDDGDIVGTSVTFSIYLTYLGDGGYTAPEVKVLTETVKGKTSSAYVRNKTFDLSKYRRSIDENPGYQIRVTRDTIDRDTATAQNTNIYFDKMYLEYVTMVTSSPLRYPNSALIALQVNAQAFGSIPSRGYKVRLLKIKIPTNYFPTTRTYNRAPNGSAVLDIFNQPVDQPWDGTFYTAWSNNPAWAFYDLATNSRYGLGDLLNANYGTIDKWALYKIGRYCDEQVDDGFGGREPRFTINTYFQTRAEAFRVITELASAFRAVLYWAQGGIVAVQDSFVPDERTVYQFTNSNVKDGMFNYSSTARKARHTVAFVTWNDPNDLYKPKVEYVEDPVGIAKYGFNQIEVTIPGCTSRGQARRHGLFILYTELHQTETNVFRTGFEGAYLRPFDIIKTFDKNRAGVEYAGRILWISPDRTRVILDTQVAAEPGTLFTLVVVNPTPYVAETEAVSESEEDLVRQSQLTKLRVASFDHTAVIPEPPTTTPVDSEDGTGPILSEDGTSVVSAESDAPAVDSPVLDADGDPVLSEDGTSYVQQESLPSPSPIADSSGETVLAEDGVTPVVQEDATEPTLGADTPSYLTLNLTAPLPEGVGVGSVWGLETDTISPQLFRVLSIEEIKPNEFEVTCLAYDPGKYQFIESGISFDKPTTSLISLTPQPPASVSIQEFEVDNGTGTLLHKIHVSWVPPSTGVVTSYAVYIQQIDGATQLLTATTGLSIDTNVVQPGTYTFQVYSIGITGTYSTSATEASISVGEPTTAVDEFSSKVERITGLELFNSGSDPVFYTPDARFDWRLNSAKNSYDIGSEPSGANSGSMSPDFSNYRIRIFDPNIFDNPETLQLENLIYEGTTVDPFFTFTYQNNLTLSANRRSRDSGGHLVALPNIPWRTFLFEVSYRNTNNEITPPEKLLVTNPAPATVDHSLVTISRTNGKLYLTFPKSTNKDFNGWRVWISPSSGFIPSDHTDLTVTPNLLSPAFEGRSNPAIVPAETDGTYYIRYAEIDTFAIQILDCNISTERSYNTITGLSLETMNSYPVSSSVSTLSGSTGFYGSGSLASPYVSLVLSSTFSTGSLLPDETVIAW